MGCVTRSAGGQAGELGATPLDMLINNAGIYRERWGRDLLGSIACDDWQDTFAVNVLGAVRVSETLIDTLVRGERRLIVAISSHMGKHRGHRCAQ